MLISSSFVVTMGAHVYGSIFDLKLDKTCEKRVFLT
jgi:hypothetical protein